MKHWRPQSNPEMVSCLEGATVMVPLGGGAMEPRLVPQDPDLDWWQRVDINGPHIGDPEWTYAKEIDVPQQVVRYTWAPATRTIDEAESQKLAEASEYREASMVSVPLQANGQVVKIVFDEAAQIAFASIPEAPSKRPAEGMPVRLLPPGYQKNPPSSPFLLVYDVKGDAVFDLVEAATFAHRCAADRAMAAVYVDIETIKAGGGTDTEKVAAIDAIDVNSKGWPSPDVPA